MNDKLAPMSDTSGSENKEQQLLQYLALFTFAAGAEAYGLPLYDKTPYHTSAFTGADWVHELLDGHPEPTMVCPLCFSHFLFYLNLLIVLG